MPYDFYRYLEVAPANPATPAGGAVANATSGIATQAQQNVNQATTQAQQAASQAAQSSPAQSLANAQEQIKVAIQQAQKANPGMIPHLQSLLQTTGQLLASAQQGEQQAKAAATNPQIAAQAAAVGAAKTSTGLTAA